MLNKIMLIGNAGREPEMTYTPSGSAVTKFSLAVSRRRNDKGSGEKITETTWFNVVAWERLAEVCNQFVHKGSKIYVEGRMQSREYTDKDGVKRTVFEVIMSDMQLLDSRADGPSGGRSEGGSVPAATGEMDGEDFPF